MIKNYCKPCMLMTVFAVVVSTPFQNGDRFSRDDDDQAEKAKIESILDAQARCWNNKDINGFMETYWKSQQLTFSGGGVTTRGWNATLDRYKKKYPPEKMGRLTFDHLETRLLNESAALVLGQWHLQVEPTAANGNFSLVLKQFDGEWKIIHDHSSTKEAE